MRALALRLTLLTALLGTSACDWPQQGSFVIDSGRHQPGTRYRNPSTPPPPSPAAGEDGDGTGAGSGNGAGIGGNGSGSGGATQGGSAPDGGGSFTGTVEVPSNPQVATGDGTSVTPPPGPCKRMKLADIDPENGVVLNSRFQPEPAFATFQLRLVSECASTLVSGARLTYLWRDAQGATSLVPVTVRLSPILVPAASTGDGPVTPITVPLQSLQLEPFLAALPAGAQGELSVQVQFLDDLGGLVANTQGGTLTIEVPVER